MNTENNLLKPVLILSLATASLLLVPLIAMQYTDEVAWTVEDFLFAGVILFSTGLAYLLVTRVFAAQKADNIIYRIAIGFSLFTALFLIWVNGAVGIIGSEANPLNLLYYGVIVIGLIGAFVSRLRPGRMAITMLAMAFGQALITAVAITGGFYQSQTGSVIKILSVNGMFIVLFVASAWLFHYTSQDESDTITKTESSGLNN